MVKAGVQVQNRHVQKTLTDQNTFVLQLNASLLWHAQNVIANLCYFVTRLPAPPWEAPQGATPPTPEPLAQVGPSFPRSRPKQQQKQRSLHLGLLQLNTGNTSPKSSNPATFMEAIQNCGQQGDRGALFATLLLGKIGGSQALSRIIFWVSGCQLSSVTFCTWRGRRRHPESCLSIRLPQQARLIEEKTA